MYDDRAAKGKIWPALLWTSVSSCDPAHWCPSAGLNNCLARRPRLVHSYISPRSSCVVISPLWQPAAVTWSYYCGPFADASWMSVLFSLAVKSNPAHFHHLTWWVWKFPHNKPRRRKQVLVLTSFTKPLSFRHGVSDQATQKFCMGYEVFKGCFVCLLKRKVVTHQGVSGVYLNSLCSWNGKWAE